MNVTDIVETENSENLDSKHTVQIAFQAVKETCQQLKNKLAAVEKENIVLRLECGKHSVNMTDDIDKQDEQTFIKELKDKIESLTQQKSQLTRHVFMVAAENRQLWKKLSQLTQANKSLSKQLTNIMDTLKQHPTMDSSLIMSYSFKSNSNLENEMSHNCQSSVDSGNKEPSLEEISLKLINNIMLEKYELEQQCAEMVELQSSSPVNFQNVGLTYPEVIDTSSLEQLKHHEIRLSQNKEALAIQQERLKKLLQNVKKLKNGATCQNCLNKESKKLHRAERQIAISEIQKENTTTQTSLPFFTDVDEKSNLTDNEEETDVKICPLCGVSFESSTPFLVFHKHVLSHFASDFAEELVN